MAKILCAIRGGEASQRTQDVAIELAKERGDEIVFLYVVNTEFLEPATSVVVRESMTTEMGKLGEFLLLMTLERAQKQGVTASTRIRYGKLLEEIEAVACEPEITTIVLGKPGGEESFFSMESLNATAQELAEKAQVDVVIR